ncbi:hypothetical protein ACIRPQ_03815 [Streptomyces sp. NPDC101213]|uniref:hypothetical protein n=1 Tax=Streptomyces sp. NPDC101213 TaxID=3366130 RepID=UPI00380CFB21
MITVLTGGFKAQVAAAGRRAAARHHHALRKVCGELLAESAEFDPEPVTGTPLERLSVRQSCLHRAYRFRAVLRRIDFVPVISPGSSHRRGPVTAFRDRAPGSAAEEDADRR